jgi:hypothetical protein
MATPVKNRLKNGIVFSVQVNIKKPILFQNHISNTLTGKPLEVPSGCAVLVLVGIVTILALMLV